MTATTRLAEIKALAEAATEGGDAEWTYAEAAADFTPQAVEALEGVLGLHGPADDGSCLECEWLPWPCKTRASRRRSEVRFGVDLIAAERQRQIEVLGYDAEHDAAHAVGIFAREGACYADYVASRLEGMEQDASEAGPHPFWPNDGCPWKPSSDDVRTLVKAGALIAAEIDRLTREAALAGEETANG